MAAAMSLKERKKLLAKAAKGIDGGTEGGATDGIKKKARRRSSAAAQDGTRVRTKKKKEKQPGLAAATAAAAAAANGTAGDNEEDPQVVDPSPPAPDAAAAADPQRRKTFNTTKSNKAAGATADGTEAKPRLRRSTLAGRRVLVKRNSIGEPQPAETGKAGTRRKSTSKPGAGALGAAKAGAAGGKAASTAKGSSANSGAAAKKGKAFTGAASPLRPPSVPKTPPTRPKRQVATPAAPGGGGAATPESTSGSFTSVQDVVAHIEKLKQKRVVKLNDSSKVVQGAGRRSVIRTKTSAKALAEAYATGVTELLSAVASELGKVEKRAATSLRRVPKGQLGRETFLRETAIAVQAATQAAEEAELHRRGRSARSAGGAPGAFAGSRLAAAWTMTEEEKAADQLPPESLEAAEAVVTHRAARRLRLLTAATELAREAWQQCSERGAMIAEACAVAAAEAIAAIEVAQPRDLAHQLARVRMSVRRLPRRVTAARRAFLAAVSGTLLPDGRAYGPPFDDDRSSADVDETMAALAYVGPAGVGSQGRTPADVPAGGLPAPGELCQASRVDSSHPSGQGVEGFASLEALMRWADAEAAARLDELLQRRAALCLALQAFVARLDAQGAALGEVAASWVAAVPDVTDEVVPRCVRSVSSAVQLLPPRLKARESFVEAFNDALGLEEPPPTEGGAQEEAELDEAVGIRQPEEAVARVQRRASGRLSFLEDRQRVLAAGWAAYKNRLRTRGTALGQLAALVMLNDLPSARDWELPFHRERVKRTLLLAPRSAGGLSGVEPAILEEELALSSRELLPIDGRDGDTGGELPADTLRRPLPVAFAQAFLETIVAAGAFASLAAPGALARAELAVRRANSVPKEGEEVQEEEVGRQEASAEELAALLEREPLPGEEEELAEGAPAGGCFSLARHLTVGQVVEAGKAAALLRTARLVRMATVAQRWYRDRRHRRQLTGEAIAQLAAGIMTDIDRALDRELDALAARAANAIRRVQRKDAERQFLQALNMYLHDHGETCSAPPRILLSPERGESPAAGAGAD